ncbi:hypothetical protein [Streptomyces sp. NPDC126499]|uniref:hypothetical protein n=1 Tax=Streptomyces sp. NPDC126499 TaxID=3155314 RepID=UPI0033238382
MTTGVTGLTTGLATALTTGLTTGLTAGLTTGVPGVTTGVPGVTTGVTTGVPGATTGVPGVPGLTGANAKEPWALAPTPPPPARGSVPRSAVSSTTLAGPSGSGRVRRS